MWQENKERTAWTVKTLPIPAVSAEEIESGSLYFYLLDQPKGTSTIFSPHHPIVTESNHFRIDFHGSERNNGNSF